MGIIRYSEQDRKVLVEKALELRQHNVRATPVMLFNQAVREVMPENRQRSPVTSLIAIPWWVPALEYALGKNPFETANVSTTRSVPPKAKPASKAVGRPARKASVAPAAELPVEPAADCIIGSDATKTLSALNKLVQERLEQIERTISALQERVAVLDSLASRIVDLEQLLDLWTAPQQRATQSDAVPLTTVPTPLLNAPAPAGAAAEKPATVVKTQPSAKPVRFEQVGILDGLSKLSSRFRVVIFGGTAIEFGYIQQKLHNRDIELVHELPAGQRKRGLNESDLSIQCDFVVIVREAVRLQESIMISKAYPGKTQIVNGSVKMIVSAINDRFHALVK